MDDMQPIGPTRRYVIVCHDVRRIQVDAEAMWPGRVVPRVLGNRGCHRSRQVCVRRIAGEPQHTTPTVFVESAMLTPAEIEQNYYAALKPQAQPV
ncbi:MAG: hypothetical protein ABJA86_06355 [Nocardioidaceae bacterium]